MAKKDEKKRKRKRKKTAAKTKRAVKRTVKRAVKRRVVKRAVKRRVRRAVKRRIKRAVKRAVKRRVVKRAVKRRVVRRAVKRPAKRAVKRIVKRAVKRRLARRISVERVLAPSVARDVVQASVVFPLSEISKRAKISRSYLYQIRRGTIGRVRADMAKRLRKLAIEARTSLVQPRNVPSVKTPVRFPVTRLLRYDPSDPKRKRMIPSDTISYRIPKTARLQDIFDLIEAIKGTAKAVKIVVDLPAGTPDYKGFVYDRRVHMSKGWESTLSNVFDSPEALLEWIVDQTMGGQIIYVQFIV
jgi:adenylate kinase